MRRRFMPLFNGLIWATLLSGMPVTSALAATGNCATLGSIAGRA
jgi:pilus assembly protein CpaC